MYWKKNNETLPSKTKTCKWRFLLQRLFYRCKCLLCHDSTTIYLQFSSIVKSNITIYCQLERGKKCETVSREGFCSLAHLLVLELHCFPERVCPWVCGHPMFFWLIWIAWGHGTREGLHSWTAHDTWQSWNALRRKLAEKSGTVPEGLWIKIPSRLQIVDIDLK